MSCILFTDMANYRSAILRYCLHIAGTCMFRSFQFLLSLCSRIMNDKLEAQDKELRGEEENLHSVLKTAEALVSEADDKLKKSIVYRI